MLQGGGFNQLKPCRHGYMLYNQNDGVIGASLERYGEFTEHEIEIFAQIVKPGDVVLDVGANIGTHTVALARLVGPTGAVYAFEPQRLIFQTLCANLALNSLTNGHAFNMAVGAAPGTATLPVIDPTGLNNFGGVSLKAANQGEVVQVAALDDLELAACRLIKIDVEGMEREVLSGAAKTLERFRPILYVENNQADKSDALIRAIDQLGYAMYWHRVPYFNPNNFYGNQDPYLAQFLAEPNMICLPKEMRQTMQGFEPVAVPGA